MGKPFTLKLLRINLSTLYLSVVVYLLSSIHVQGQATVPGQNFGYTSGQFAVSDAGAATYAIPLDLPPGTAGLQPQLSLQYSSLGGNGPLGLGWSMQGLSAITRIGRTRAQDETTTSTSQTKSVALNVSYTKDDRYTLDGSRLVLAPESVMADQRLDINYGNDQTIYYTEQQTFTRVILYTNPATGAPQFFKAYTKSGLIIEYGNTDNARVLDPIKQIGVQWLVNRIEDRKGNYMTFSYLRDASTGENYPDRIDYTGNAAGNLTPYNQIQFVYETRPDQTVLYGLRFQQKNTLSRRLTTIKVIAQNTVIRQYNLAYQVNRYSLLSSVTECDNNGICFKPTTFQWQGSTGTPGNATALSINPSKTIGDFNGDGLLDFVNYSYDAPLITSGQYQGQYNVTTKYDFRINDGQFNFNQGPLQNGSNYQISSAVFNEFKKSTPTVGELNADNIADVILQWPFYVGDPSIAINVGFNVILSDPAPNDPYTSRYKYSPYAYTGKSQINFIDISGDAISDVVAFHFESGKPVFGNTTVFKEIFVDNSISSYPVSQSLTGYNTGLNFSNPESLIADFNGDGIAEWFAYDKATGNNLIVYGESVLTESLITERQNIYQIRYRQYRNNSIDPGLLAGADAKILIFDANADKLVDLVYYLPAQNLIRIFPSRGDGTFDAPINFNPISGVASVLAIYPFITQIDHDADGLMDLLFYDINTGGNLLFLNQGNFTFALPSQPTDIYPTAMFKSGNWYKIGPFLKGSVADVLYYDAAQNKSFIVPLGQKNSILITNIINGANLVTTVQYDNLLNQDFHKRVGAIEYPVIDFQAALSATAKVRVSSPDGYKSGISYRYEGATLNIEGRGFRGFSKIIATDTITGIYTIKTYRQGVDSWRYGSTPLLKVERFYGDGGQISIVENTASLVPYPTSTPGDQLDRAKCFFAYNNSQKTIDYTTGKTRYTRQQMDEYGNPIYVVTDYANGYRDSTRITYQNDTNRWLLGLPFNTNQFYMGVGQPTINRQRNADYEATTGLVVRKTTYPDLIDQQKQVVTYSYDAFGNVIQQDLMAWNGSQNETRTTKATFEPTGRFAITQANALNQVSSATYDPKLGLKLTATDPNNLVITYQYDGFGRSIKQTSPDGTWQATAYRVADGSLFTSPANAVYLTYQQTSQGQIIMTHMDAYGRSVQTKTKGFDGRFTVIQRTYQRVGVTDQVKETYPYHEGEAVSGYTISEQDILNRPSKRYETKAGGQRLATVTYAGQLTINTNYAGQTKIEVRDSKDQLVECRWNDGHNVYYGYNTAGDQVTSRDLKNNTIVHDYDARGYETAMSDPDMGLYHYTYNGFGELTSQTYPNGDVVQMEYDRLGRLVKRTEKEGITAWQYDTGNKAVGNLSSVNSFATQTSYVYDNLARRSQETQLIDGQSFTSSYAYDAQGRLQQLTYPTGLKLKYNYNAYNYLTELRNGATDALFWKQTTADASGHRTQQQFGNGVVTDQQYDPATQYLLGIKSTYNSAVLQQFAYQYDDLANLTTRQDVKRGKREAFTYDALNRLTSSQLDGASSISMEYDELGNITSKSDVGKYFYGPSGNGPHRVTAIASSAGSVPCSYSLNIGAEYNSFNKVSRMSNDTTYAQITYDESHQRVMQKLFVRNNLSRTKRYVGNLLEVETFADGRNRTTHYLNGIGLWIDEKAISGSISSQVKYALKDHLGSNTGFTSTNGVLTDEFSFDAWGQRRNADWTLMTTTYTGYEQGFTEHEHYDLFSLIDMNGRVYDPVLARFLSPDPVVQDQTNLQALNRYSYVANNPLNGTDPSGYFDVDPETRFGLSINAYDVNFILSTSNYSLSESQLYYGKGDYNVNSLYKLPSNNTLSTNVTAQVMVSGSTSNVLTVGTGQNSINNSISEGSAKINNSAFISFTQKQIEENGKQELASEPTTKYINSQLFINNTLTMNDVERRSKDQGDMQIGGSIAGYAESLIHELTDADGYSPFMRSAASKVLYVADKGITLLSVGKQIYQGDLTGAATSVTAFAVTQKVTANAVSVYGQGSAAWIRGFTAGLGVTLFLNTLFQPSPAY